MAVTSKQIAEMVHVSRGTVDRVLNNRGGVKKETEQKVREIAEKLGYVPNRAGKALSSSKRTILLGLVLNCEGNPFYGEVLRGIESAKNAYPDFAVEFKIKKLRGYHVEDQIKAIGQLQRSGVSALIITPVNDESVAQKINKAVAAGIPVVTLNTDIEHTDRLLHVGCNYLASGKTAVGIIGLLTGGRASVAIVTGSMSMLGHSQRVRGFLDDMERDYPNMSCVDIVENYDDDTKSYEVVKHLMKKSPEITAVYFAAGGVNGGIRAIEQCCEGKMPIIITCDDVEQTKQLVKKGKIEATICQQPHRQGFEAVSFVLEYLISNKKPENDVVYMENQIKIAQNID
jgi:LacI family transcriptional regulator